MWPAMTTAAPTAGLYRNAAQAGVELLVDGHLDGSGVIVSRDGLVVTAAHLITGTRLEVHARHLGRHRVTLIALDPGHDLALLQLPRRPRPYPHLSLASRQSVPGADVYLYGSPLYRHGILMRGALARESPSYEYQPHRGHYVRALHVSGPSPIGSSGGPWLNSKGQVIGIQSGLIHDGTAPAGLAYMAPLTALRRLIRHRRTPAVATLRAGFEELWEQTPALRALFPDDAQGVLPVRIVPGGPADRAGLRPTDLITAIDDRRIGMRDDLLDAIRARSTDSPLTLHVLRPRVGPLDLRIIPDDLGRSSAAPAHVLAFDTRKTSD